MMRNQCRYNINKVNGRCVQQVFFIPDFTREPERCVTYKEGGYEHYFYAHPLIPHPSELCYYHLKKEEGLIE